MWVIVEKRGCLWDLLEGMLSPTAHVTTLGADVLGKVEVSVGFVLGSSHICEDRKLSLQQGVLASLALTKDYIAAELGEVFAALPGRSSEYESG